MSRHLTLLRQRCQISPGAPFQAGLPTQLVEGTSYLNGPGTPNLGRTYDVSPDGHRFLMIKELIRDTSGPAPQLNIVLNWLDELKQRVPVR